MAINGLVRIGNDSAGVILPIDDLRDESLVEKENGELEVDDCTLRVERVVEGVWIVARTDDVDFEDFNELRSRVVDS